MSQSSKRFSWLARIHSWVHSTHPRPTIRQQRGRSGERLACAYLRRYGYEIEATNIRFPVGELDIVAKEGSTLCFVEVRSASSPRFGPAAASITARKRQHFVRAVRWYLQRRRVPWSGTVRFDVVAIDHNKRGDPTIELIRGAFEA